MTGDFGGRHRRDSGEPVPWLRRPRSRLNVALHRLYLVVVWVIVLLLVAGGVAVSTGSSGTDKLLGALGILAGTVMAVLVILHLARPVKR